MTRGSITKDEKLQTSSVIIEPMSMTVYLTRNLSPWFHEIPDVNVHGKLRAVEVHIYHLLHYFPVTTDKTVNSIYT